MRGQKTRPLCVSDCGGGGNTAPAGTAQRVLASHLNELARPSATASLVARCPPTRPLPARLGKPSVCGDWRAARDCRAPEVERDLLSALIDDDVLAQVAVERCAILARLATPTRARTQYSCSSPRVVMASSCDGDPRGRERQNKKHPKQAEMSPRTIEETRADRRPWLDKRSDKLSLAMLVSCPRSSEVVHELPREPNRPTSDPNWSRWTNVLPSWADVDRMYATVDKDRPGSANFGPTLTSRWRTSSNIARSRPRPVRLGQR